MIGQISGQLIEIHTNQGLIQTKSGLTFLVYLTPQILNKYPINSQLTVYTYLQVRDNGLFLFGFSNYSQYQLFNDLLAVPGVGPKIAYSIISFTTEKDLIQAIKDNNPDYLTNIPGLGKKLSMKIILELSQKLKQEFAFDKIYLSEDDKLVVDALMALGFNSQEARKMIQKIPKQLSIEERIKQALKLSLSKRNL